MERLGALDERECWELLGSVSVGHVGLSIGALPSVLPAQYYRDGQTLVICLGSDEVPMSSLIDAVIAFSVDAFDSSSGVGWAVQAQGIAHHATTGGMPTSSGQESGEQVVHLEPVNLKGQRLRLRPFAATF